MAKDSLLRLRIWAQNATRAGLRAAWSGIRSLGGSIKRFGLALGRNIVRGAQVASAALTAFAATAIKLASDAEETGNKFHEVFSTIKAEADAAAKSFQKSFGLASDQAKRLLGDTGDILVGFGFTEEKALELAVAVNKLAGDLASFTNIEGGVNTASKALTSALVGETERAKALGIVIRQDSKEFKNLVKEFKKTEGATLLQAKAQAAFTIAQNQSQKAQGDYARTAGQLANRLRTTKNMFRDLTVEIGNQLIKGLDLNEMVGRLIGKIKEWTSQLRQSRAVQDFAERARAAFDQVLTVVKALFGDEKERKIVLEGLEAGAHQIGQRLARGALTLLLKGVPMIGIALGKFIKQGFKEGFAQNEARAKAVAKLRQEGKFGRGQATAEWFKGLVGASGEKVQREAMKIRQAELSAQGESLAASFAGAAGDKGVAGIWQNILLQLEKLNTETVPRLRQPD